MLGLWTWRGPLLSEHEEDEGEDSAQTSGLISSRRGNANYFQCSSVTAMFIYEVVHLFLAVLNTASKAHLSQECAAPTGVRLGGIKMCSTPFLRQSSQECRSQKIKKKKKDPECLGHNLGYLQWQKYSLFSLGWLLPPKINIVLRRTTVNSLSQYTEVCTGKGKS